MSNSGDIIRSIRSNGRRVTKVRRAIVNIICESECPVSVLHIRNRLEAQNITPNKTTIYRELSFLLEMGVVKEVVVLSGATSYELASLPHHHHLICSKCGSTKKVVCKEIENDMCDLVKRVQKGGFIIEKHNLEFVGLCSNCS